MRLDRTTVVAKMTQFGTLPLPLGAASRDRAGNTGAVIADMARTTEIEDILHFRAHELTLVHSTCRPPRYVSGRVRAAISPPRECCMAGRQRRLAFTEV